MAVKRLVKVPNNRPERSGKVERWMKTPFQQQFQFSIQFRLTLLMLRTVQCPSSVWNQPPEMNWRSIVHWCPIKHGFHSGPSLFLQSLCVNETIQFIINDFMTNLFWHSLPFRGFIPLELDILVSMHSTEEIVNSRRFPRIGRWFHYYACHSRTPLHSNEYYMGFRNSFPVEHEKSWYGIRELRMQVS